MRRIAQGRRAAAQSPARANRKLQMERLEGRALLALSPIGLISSAEECRAEAAYRAITPALPAELAAGAAVDAAAAATPSAASSLASLPRLSSNPSATAKLFLDFDGHYEATWASNTNISTPAYDRDGDRTTFSDAELGSIQQIWASVAEDYAPFNIDVTTIDPGTAANRVAATIAIGGSAADWYGVTAGGVAYVGGFYNSAPNVGFVFEENLANGYPKYVAEAAAHEAGHLFGLSHQATWNGSTLTAEYNPGNTAWAPIMGVGYNSLRTTWYAGLTSYNNTSIQDDLSILAGANNGFGYKPDDFGDSTATAAPLPATSGSVNFSGLIGRNGDVDMWSFSTSGGQVSLQLSPAAVSANLDAVLELRSDTGQVLAAAAPVDSLGASWTANVAAGTYYVVARSNGDYGDMGQYTITGSLPATTPPPPPPPTSTAQIIDDGDAGFSTTGVWIPYGGQGYQNDVHYTAAGVGLNAAQWTAAVTPGQYEVAVSYSPLYNRATNAPFTVLDGATSLGTKLVNQQLAPADFVDQGVSWKSLGTFNVTGNNLSVVLTDLANLYVIADAVRIYRVGDLPTTPPPPVATTQIINNSDAGFRTAGSWIPYSGQGYQSDVAYTAAGDGSSTARWTASVSPGQYQVAITWSAYYNRATNAPFSIYDGSAKLGTTAVNQQAAPADFSDQGVMWKSLGTFNVTSGNLAVELGNNANQYVIADAVRLVRIGDLPVTPPPAATQVINDVDAGFSTSGYWIPYAGQGYDNEVHYAAAGWGGSAANWTASVTPGQYRVSVTWSAQGNRATNAPYSVYDGSTNLGTTIVNQQLAPGDLNDQGMWWKTLGTFNVTGNALTVSLSDLANSYVIADAVRIERVGSLAPALDDAEPAAGSGCTAQAHDAALDELLAGCWELEEVPLPDAALLKELA